MNKSIVFLDIETTGLNKRKDRIIGIGLKVLGEPAEYLFTTTEEERSVAALRLLALQGTARLVCHNAAFDLQFIKNYFKIDLVDDLYADTMLLKHTVDENPPFALKDIGKMLFGDGAKAEQDELKASIIANGGSATKKNYELYKADPAVIAKYCKKDLELTEAVYLHYIPSLEAQGLQKFYFDEEVMPLYRSVTIPMENYGIKLDTEKMRHALVDITADLKVIEAEVQSKLSELCGDFKSWFYEKHYPVKTSGNFLQALCEIEGEDLPKTATGKMQINAKTKKLIRSETIKQFLQSGELDPTTTERIQSKMHYRFGASDYFINISSKDHLRLIVFKYLKEKPERHTTAGAWQLDNKYLETLRDKYAFIAPLLVFSKLSKIKATYIERYLEKQEDGIFYPSFMQHRTISGRYGSDVQQLPRAMESGDPIILKYTNMVRTFFISRPGKIFIDTDYESLEPHVFASVSGDKGLHDIFNNNQDFYSTIAIASLGLQGVSADKSAPNYLGKTNKSARQNFKAIALGVPYGLQSFKLSKELNIDQDAAETLISGYMKAYPNLEKWMRDTDARVITTGEIKTIAGRIRHIPEATLIYEKHGAIINDDLALWKKYNKIPAVYADAKQDRKVYKNLINNARNFQIQSLAASIVNRACIAIAKHFKAENIEAHICCQVHDSIIVEASEKHLDYAKTFIQNTMENIIKLDVQLKAPPGIGNNFAESH